jgi:hypothetical protein
MAQPTILNRVQGAAQQAAPEVQNPNFPKFFSTQNAKNFFGDVVQGAGYGLQGGVVGGLAGGVYNASSAASSAGQPALQSLLQTVPGQKLPAGVNFSQSAGNASFMKALQTPVAKAGFLDTLKASTASILPEAKKINAILDQFASANKPNNQIGNPERFTPKPTAQSGPSIISQGSGSQRGGMQKQQYSFEKYFSNGGAQDMRPLIETYDKMPGIPQSGAEDNPNQVANQKTQQPPQPQVPQYGRPNTEGKDVGILKAIKGYAYDTFNWLHDSPWSQRIAGFLAGGAATVLSGGALAPLSPLIAAGVGGLFKGLTGQIKNFLAERTDLEQQQQANQPAQQSTPQLQQTPGILRAA